MQLNEIIDKATYQLENWYELGGVIESYDVKQNKLRLSGLNLDFSLNDVSREQFLKRMEIRGTWEDFSEDKDFLQQSIDRKIATTNDKHMKYMTKVVYDRKTNEVKGLLTNKFKRVYNMEVLNIVIDKNIQLNKNSFIDDRIMILVEEGEEMDASVLGEVAGIGLRIFNSEVGLASLGLNFYMEILNCKNGAIFELGNEYKIRHIYNDGLGMFKQLINSTFDYDMIKRRIINAKNSPEIYSINDIEKYIQLYKFPKCFAEPVGKILKGDFGKHEGDMFNRYQLFASTTNYLSHDFRSENNDEFLRQEFLKRAVKMLGD